MDFLKNNINTTGYLDGYPTSGNPYNIIPGGDITMQGVSTPVIAVPYKKGKKGKPTVMQPGQDYKFDADYVYERRGNIYQQGGATPEEIFKYLFDDDDRETDSPATAPSTDELDEARQQLEDEKASFRKQQQQQTEDLDEEQMIMGMQPYETSSRDRTNKRRGNPYTSQEYTSPPPGQIDQGVLAATEELRKKFPSLRITSTIRNWGDKDAHPKGRAIDVAGPETDEAWKYYKDVIVPKYNFSPALNPNHGTGKHIHVGYYERGGTLTNIQNIIDKFSKKEYTLPYEETVNLRKNQL